jgi:hypothetical protein
MCFPPGYSRFSALIGTYPCFRLFRRFSRLRSRLLLLKQDRLAVLEQQLDDIDRDEPKPLFLGNLRRDVNQDRKGVVSDIEAALKDYG